MCEVRPANLNDLEDVYSLINELENAEMDKALFEQVYRLNLSNSAVSYYLAVDSGEIVGFISLHIQELLHHTTNIGEIQELIVKSTFRCSGIGKKLFEQATETARLKKCTQLEVCCNQNNANGQGFYMSHGMINSHYKFCMSLE